MYHFWQTILKKCCVIEKPLKKIASKLNKNYLCQLRHLKTWVFLGIDIAKQKLLMNHKQKPWTKNYIDENTEKRAEAQSDIRNVLLEESIKFICKITGE